MSVLIKGMEMPKVPTRFISIQQSPSRRMGGLGIWTEFWRS